MTRFVIIPVALLLFVTSQAFAAKPKTEEDKTLYALGLAISQNLVRYDLSKKELALVQSGIADGVKGKESDITLEEYGPKLSALSQTRLKAAAEKEKLASQSFLSERAKEKGAQTFESGLIYFELAAGDGAQPAPTDRVKVHYHGTTRDGKVFDSSVERGEPAAFGLSRVIPCWTEGVQKMRVGGKARLVCPASIAYGDRGSPPRIAPGAVLEFEVELLSIE